MVTVQFFGLLRLQLNTASVTSQGKTVNEVLSDIGSRFPEMGTGLKDYVIFVNGKNITDLKMFRTKIKEGDTLTIMSPVSGG